MENSQKVFSGVHEEYDTIHKIVSEYTEIFDLKVLKGVKKV